MAAGSDRIWIGADACMANFVGVGCVAAAENDLSRLETWEFSFCFKTEPSVDGSCCYISGGTPCTLHWWLTSLAVTWPGLIDQAMRE